MKIPEDRGVLFMNAKLIAVIPKNKREEIRISLLRNNKIDVRTYFTFSGETEPRPTKKGIFLSFKHIKPIVDALEGYAAEKKSIALSFDQTEKSQLRVYSAEFKGADIIHIRAFYAQGGEFLPGKGVSFPGTSTSIVCDAFNQLLALPQK